MGYVGEQKNRYQREWVAKRRASFLVDKCCVRCNSIIDLEIDHINAAEKVSHSFWSWSWDRIEEELKKCQVLCKPCHAIKTVEAGERLPQRHGSRNMYGRLGCRCDICRAGNTARRRDYRARKRAGVLEQEYRAVLNTAAERLAGSTPVTRT